MWMEELMVCDLLSVGGKRTVVRERERDRGGIYRESKRKRERETQ